MEKILLATESFLASPITWGVATLVLSAVALSGRFSVSAANWLLLFAWLTAAFGIFRAGPKEILLRLLVTVFFASGVAIIFLYLSKWFVQPVPVSVQPSTMFMLRSGERISRTNVLVTDTSSRPLYSAWVKIFIHGDGVVSNDIIVEPDQRSLAPMAQYKGKRILTDVIMWDWIGPEGNPSVLIRFFVLTPGDTRKLSVSSRSTRDCSASVRVLKVSEEPSEVSGTKDEAIVTFEPPEDGKATGMRYMWQGTGSTPSTSLEKGPN
jgi:hypothetical protein